MVNLLLSFILLIINYVSNKLVLYFIFENYYNVGIE